MSRDPQALEGNFLLPHQQGLVDQFLQRGARHSLIVRWHTGIGASFAAVHLIKQYLASNTGDRVILLTPKALAFQWRDRLSTLNVQTELVDRFRFRELQDANTNDGVIWKEGVVYILSVDFAKRPDIAASLSSVDWALLVMDEAHQLSGQKEAALSQIVKSSPGIRVLLLTMALGCPFPSFGLTDWEESRVTSRDVVDTEGRHIIDDFTPDLVNASFDASASEERLSDSVMKFLNNLSGASPNPRFLRTVIESAMASSPAALEEILTGLRNRLLHLNTCPDEPEAVDEEAQSDDFPLVHASFEPVLVPALRACLEDLDAVVADTKLKTLQHVLTEATTGNADPPLTCVLTKYKATLFYIHAGVDEVNLQAEVLHGSQSIDERHLAVRRFQERGGILISSIAMMSEGLNLSQVDRLVFYDLPNTRMLFEQVIGRFNRYGRKKRLKIVVVGTQDMMGVAGGWLNDLYGSGG